MERDIELSSFAFAFTGTLPFSVTIKMSKEKKQRVEPASGSGDLLSLARKKYVSANALAAILKAIDEHGLPAATSASTYARQRKKATHQVTPLGEMIFLVSVPLIAGGFLDVPLTNPYALLYVALLGDIVFRRFC